MPAPFPALPRPTTTPPHRPCWSAQTRCWREVAGFPDFTSPSPSSSSIAASEAMSASKRLSGLELRHQRGADEMVSVHPLAGFLLELAARARTASCASSTLTRGCPPPEPYLPKPCRQARSAMLISPAFWSRCALFLLPRFAYGPPFYRPRSRSPSMQNHAAQHRAQRLTGIALMCGAIACFSLLDTTAKYLNLHMSTLEVAWARYTGAFLFPFILSNPWTRPGLTVTPRPGLYIWAFGAAACLNPVQLCSAALPATR